MNKQSCKKEIMCAVKGNTQKDGVLQLNYRGRGKCAGLRNPCVIVNRSVGDFAHCCNMQSAAPKIVVGGIC